MAEYAKEIVLRRCTTYTPVGTRVLVTRPGYAPVLTRTKGAVEVGRHAAVVRVEGFRFAQDLCRVWLMPGEGESDG